MNFSKTKLLEHLCRMLGVNALISGVLGGICGLKYPILFVYLGVFLGISALVTFMLITVILSVKLLDLRTKSREKRRLELKRMELEEEEYEEFLSKLQNVSSDTEEQLLKTAIRDIVSEVLLEKNIINGEQLEQQVAKMLEELRQEREIDELQIYMVVKLAVQEAMRIQLKSTENIDMLT